MTSTDLKDKHNDSRFVLSTRSIFVENKILKFQIKLKHRAVQKKFKSPFR